MDSRLDQNQAELGVLVLAVALKVLSDGDSLCDVISIYCRLLTLTKLFTHLLDQHVQILRKLGSEAYIKIAPSALTNSGIIVAMDS